MFNYKFKKEKNMLYNQIHEQDTNNVQKNNNNEGTRLLFKETFGGFMRDMGRASISIKGLSKITEKAAQSYKIVASKESDDAVISQINAFFDQVEMIKEKTKDKNIQELIIEFEKAKAEFNGKIATGSYRKGSNLSSKNVVLVSFVGTTFAPSCQC